MSGSMQSGTATEKAAKRASGSSFYTAMRVMPKPEREAMYAIYAFCRAVDDIADDGVEGRDERHARLQSWRRDIDSLFDGGGGGEAAFLKPTVERYGLRKSDFLAVIDGMEMDVAEDIRAPALARLDLYCDRVASAVGRLSIKVFGMDEEPGDALAHHLGRALQLTNIVRDLDEDARMGRLYLPAELLDEAQIVERDPLRVVADARIDLAARALAQIAHEHYARAQDILAAKPRGNLRAPRLMGAVYARILSKMEANGWAPPRTRASIGKGELVLILLRHGLG